MKLFVFGSTGDLVKRKVMPALQNLKRDDLEIYALGRQDIRNEEYLGHVCNEGKCSRDFMDKINYHKINFERDDICNDEYCPLFDSKNVNYFYLSLPPNLIEKVLSSISTLKRSGLKVKVLIEKPFGENSIVAKRIHKTIEEDGLSEDVFLSDHYLFKKINGGVNGDFSRMKIVSVENVGLEGRTGYYDSVGAVRDMVQSHFFNLVFREVGNIEEEFGEFEILDFSRGQYTGYLEELGHDSLTETFVHLKFKTRTKEFEFITGKAFDSKMLHIEIDERALEIESKEDYEKLFEGFLNHEKDKFAKVHHAIFAWDLVEKLDMKSSDLFYYDKGISYEEILN